MAYTHHDRLTALDTMLLDLETPNVPMHAGLVGIFQGGPLTDSEGGLDFDRLWAIAEADLRRAPRFRQKLTRVPLSGHPVWVDDEHFNIHYHLRHASLPRPGDERALKRLIARTLSQTLDRSKPLWELWFVEGLEETRFAAIAKVHSCLDDGAAGLGLLDAFVSSDEDFRGRASEHLWIPRPQTKGVNLLYDELFRRAWLPIRAAGDALGALRQPREALGKAVHAAAGFVESVFTSLSPASETPFNVAVGPHRRFDWTRFDLGVVEEVKAKLRGTTRDVVLAAIAGAVRAYLETNGPVGDIDFRVFVPVAPRGSDGPGSLASRLGHLVVRLPVDEPDPKRRAQRVVEETSRLEYSDLLVGGRVLETLSDWTVTSVLTRFNRLATKRRSYNLVVTHTAGPAGPVYLDGARLVSAYPVAPLSSNHALGIALLSYDGGLHWGFTADWDAVEDLHELVQLVDREFEVLRKL